MPLRDSLPTAETRASILRGITQMHPPFLDPHRDPLTTFRPETRNLHPGSPHNLREGLTLSS
jgi:hypothetical protein